MQQRALLAVLALALALSAAQGRVLEDGYSASRQLQQTIDTANARCPDGCQRPGFDKTGEATTREANPQDYCQEDATQGGLFCTQCYGTLMVKLSNGRCSCPRGKYSEGNTTTTADYLCKDCPKNSYCSGGDFVRGQYQVGKEPCPNGLYTIGARTETVRGCVNQPGYSYSIDASGIPSQTICPVNTYGPGLKKQRSCVPCPTGFTTKGVVGAVRPTACIVPAGYYLKAPGQAAPCPMGEWKSGEGPSGNCTKCAFGVTTDSEGSIAEANCTKLLPGRYATAILADGTITATQICPQKYYCPGGYPSQNLFDTANPGALNATEESTIIVCPEGTWTQELGSTDVEQCLTPPGYQTFNQNTTKCAAGYYRADWKPRNQATNCLWCGNGVGAELTDRLKVYDLADPTDITYEPITSSSDDCFIEPGQGLYYSTITGQWRARNCNLNNYGVTNRTYGLTPAPCRDCPAGMITNAANSSAYYYNDTANFESAYGYIDPLACVTQAGYGYNGRIAQPCDKGSWNPEGTRETCKPCDYGYTTAGVGGPDPDNAGQVIGDSKSDCGVAAGFGYYNVSGTATLVPCPRGTFNNDTWDSNTTATCTSCTTLGGDGLFTLKEGSDSTADCSVCAGGYGGDNCATQCGGTTASYGLPDQPEGTPCTNCSYSGTGYSFSVNLTNVVYAPPAVARAGANSSQDCVAAWLQVVDKAWYMPIPSPLNSGGAFGIGTTRGEATGVATFEECLETCGDDSCQFVTYDYDAKTCERMNTVTTGTLFGDDFIAWKVGPAGDLARSGSVDDQVSTNAQVNEQGEVIKAKALPSGFYSWYQDPNARSYGVSQVFAANYTSTPLTKTQDCLNVCDEQPECAGVSFNPSVHTSPGQTSAECKLVFGNKDLGTHKRTFLRTAVSRLANPGLPMKD